MKKFFCFHCQQEFEPYTFFKWRFCPHCYRFMNDDGSGFYMVCDSCGANMPTDSKYCLKCGHGFHGNSDVLFPLIPWYQKVFAVLVCAALLSLFILLGIGVLYISFYFLLIFFIAAVLFYIFNFLRANL